MSLISPSLRDRVISHIWLINRGVGALSLLFRLFSRIAVDVYFAPFLEQVHE